MKKHIIISGVAGLILVMAGEAVAASRWYSNGVNCTASSSPCAGNNNNVAQTSGPNGAKTVQKGSNNTATTRQSGGGNIAVTVQKGNNNSSGISQNSNGIVIAAPPAP